MANKTSKLKRREMLKRAFKYIIEWLSIVIAMKLVLSKDVDTSCILTVSAVGVITFALLDMYLPSMA